jgi:urease accessory protein
MVDEPSIGSVDRLALLRLLAWLSPAFPVGAFSYAHGLETAVEQGLVTDRAGLIAYVRAVLERGGGAVDAALFAATYRAVRVGDRVRLADVVELAAAWRGTAELAAESTNQGRAFLATVRAAWPHAVLDELDGLCRGLDCVPAAPVAVAATCAAHGIGVEPALAAYLHALAANLVSAGLRLIPLGQTDGQRVVTALEPTVLRATAAGLVADLDRLAVGAPVIDLLSMAHETQHTRLFSS